MSSLPHNVNFGPRGGGGGTGGGDDNSNSQFGCPAHQSKECEVRVPERFDSSNTFEVRLQRNSLGLGFSIGGGLGREEGPWAGFVRIKKIFPLQPAWLDGRLMCGDIVVSVGGAELTGLPLVRALDLLRSGPTCTVLSVHRPCARHQELDNARLCQTVARSRSFTPATHQGLSLNLSAPLSLSLDERDNGNDVKDAENSIPPCTHRRTKYGQFTVELCKVRGSLGFSLCRGGEGEGSGGERSVLRHSVKALLREPALTDGRIRPGDKLLSANGTRCDAFSHQELVAFLRGCPERVTLVLYRDASRAQTPASPSSDENTDPGEAANLRRPNCFVPRQKQLRYEAKEMVRSLQASRTSLDGTGSPGSGSIASSSGGGGFFRRGLSPHRLNRSRAMSGDGPAQLSVFDGGGGESPVVEFPASPSEGAEDQYRSLPAFLQQRLQIEEMTMAADGEDGQQEQDSSSKSQREQHQQPRTNV